VKGRRPAGYVVASSDFWTFDAPGIFVEIPLVNQIRLRVKAWREAGYPGVTSITKRLLDHWRNPEESDARRFRWKYGVPPVGNANFAWVQHIIYHLTPTGVAGFVLANGSMSSKQSGEGETCKNLIEADLVDCMVALPDKLFYSTQIPACLWFLARDKSKLPSPAGRGAGGEGRDRRGEILFIDARKLGRMVDRTHRELTEEDIQKIADTYHAWRGEKEAGEYADVPGFCKSATLEEVRKHGYVLTPGRYVGAEAQEDDGDPFPEKMQRLVAQLAQQQAEAAKLDAAIAENLRELGFWSESQ